MRLVCISDTHGVHDQLRMLPPGDVLIHAGDITNEGTLQEIIAFNRWLGTLSFPHKIVIAGNHDRMLEHGGATLLTNCTYLQDSGCTIDGLNFWGSPWIMDNCIVRGAFTDLKGAAPPPPPETTDVLITHAGFASCLDFGEKVPGKPCPAEVTGFNALLWTVRNPDQSTPRNYRIKLHVFGHSTRDSSNVPATICAYVSVLETQYFDFLRVGCPPRIFDIASSGQVQEIK